MSDLLHRIFPSVTRRCLIFKLLCLLTAVFAVVIDRVTKIIVVNNMELYEEIPLWEGVFHWKFIRNKGAAFGMFADSRWIFLVLSSVAIIVLAVYLLRTKTENLPWLLSVGMVAGGGVGNMIDRVTEGSVVDFMYVRLIDFAVFNVADCFVTVGVFLLIILLIREMVHEFKAGKAGKSNGDDGQ